MNYLHFLMYVFILKLVIAKRRSTLLKPKRKLLGGSPLVNSQQFPFMAFITIHVSKNVLLCYVKSNLFKKVL